MPFSIINATAAVTAFREARDGNVVDPETAQRRANICETCPMRERVRVHPSDQASRILGMQANKHRVPDALKSYKCGVCGCSLLLLIPAMPEHIHKDTPAEAKVRAERAPMCWVPVAIANGTPS